MDEADGGVKPSEYCTIDYIHTLVSFPCLWDWIYLKYADQNNLAAFSDLRSPYYLYVYPYGNSSAG